LELYDRVLESADTALFVLAEKDDPRYAVAVSYKGFALFQLKRYKEAALSLEEAYDLFQVNPPKRLDLGKRVQTCLVQTCNVLGRSPPLPPLIKFPRTPHLFRPTHSKAVTQDDVILSKDNAMFQLLSSDTANITLEEKNDGSNLGLTLSLDGRSVLVQNRSHYISTGDHPQFSQLTAWTAQHKQALLHILSPQHEDNAEDITLPSSPRRILFGEWMVARHSIAYHQLPGYFVAFDLMEDDRFVSRRRLHSLLQGTGIPVAPVFMTPSFTGLRHKELEATLINLLDTRSSFRADGGPVEGIVLRVDGGDWLQHRCKLVRPDFVAGCAGGHWFSRPVEKQRVDNCFAEQYMEKCYRLSIGQEQPIDGLPEAVENPRQLAVVTYRRQDERKEAVLSILQKETKVSKQHMVVLPRNLCWLWPNEVAVSSTPKNPEQIQALHDALNIGLVITLTKEEPLPSEWFSKDCDNYFRGIDDGRSPTLRQMDDIGDDIVRAVAPDGGKAVLEHCGGGKGRAGAVAACLLLRFGRGGVKARIDAENTGGEGRSLRARTPFMTWEEAITEVRRRRPGSIETVEQENFIREYAQHLWRQAAEEEALFTDAELKGTECPTVEATTESKDPASKVIKGGSSKTAPRLKRRVPKYVIL
jgi:atypical dual specificity phosphatase